MMRLLTPKRQLALFLFFLNHNYIFALDQVTFGKGFPAEFHSEIENFIQTSWREWETQLSLDEIGDKIGDKAGDKVGEKIGRSIVIEVSEPQEIQFAGKAIGNLISINPRLNHTKFYSILAHELAHVFLFEALRKNTKIPRLLGEAFAQWITNDEQRIQSETQRFTLANSARDWLIQNESDNRADPKVFEQAVARLLMNSRDSENIWKILFSSWVKSFRLGKLSLHQINAQLREELYLPHSQISRGQIDFALFDSLAQEIINYEGNVDQNLPIGSILKPLLVAMLPQLLTSLPSRNDLSWACPNLPDIHRVRIFTWEEALIKSCNGFFLDILDIKGIKKSDWDIWKKFLFQIGAASTYETVPTSVDQAIGLSPGIEVTLIQVLKVYQWLNLNYPHILKPLFEVPKRGTLAFVSDSSWFVREKIGLKSGTIRDGNGQPLHGWIVAFGGLDFKGHASWIAVIHQEGTTPKELLVPLFNLLKKNLFNHWRKAEVQILGLVPKTAISIQCADSSFFISQTGDNPWKFTEDRKMSGAKINGEEKLMCLGGPLKISFPLKNRKLFSRNYFGLLESREFKDHKERQEKEKFFVSSRVARARQGSEWILNTSERHYLMNTVLSEFPKGNTETLKALTLILRNNQKVHRHSGRPLCDTTHCQVFGQGLDGASLSHKNKINDILRQMETKELVWKESLNVKDHWLPFYLGGRGFSEKIISQKEIQNRLNIYEPLFLISKRENTIQIVLGKQGLGRRIDYPCETFRNDLQLLSCPDMIEKEHGKWIFKGKGEGHGLGVPLIEADAFAAQGIDHLNLITKYYREISIRTEGPK